MHAGFAVGKLTRLTPNLRIGEHVDETFIDVPIGWCSRSSTDQLFTDLGVLRRVETRSVTSPPSSSSSASASASA